MSQNRKYHATTSLERSFPETPSRVFSEFANPVARVKWSAPAGDALVYDESDLRVGGRDVFRCGPEGDLKFSAETRYLAIEPDTCVVSSETLETEGQLLAVSLNTLELEPSSEGATLRLTHSDRFFSRTRVWLKGMSWATRALWKV